MNFQSAKDYLLTAALGVIFVWHGTQLQSLNSTAGKLAESLAAMAETQKFHSYRLDQHRDKIAERERIDTDLSVRVAQLQALIDRDPFKRR